MKRCRFFLLVLIVLVFPALPAHSTDTEEQTRPVMQPYPRRPPPGDPQANTLQPVTQIRINRSALESLSRLRSLTEPDPPEPAGPNPHAAIDLGDVIEDPGLLSDLESACGWDSRLIFQDEAAGHVFYYLPREILLLHDETGYGLNVQYNHIAEPGQPSVMLTAEMAAPHRDGDVGLLRAILREAFGLSPSDPLALHSMKGIGATVDFDASVTGLSLSPERIHVYPPASLRHSFRLTLALTQDELEEVLAQISREGLSGRLWVPAGSESVPVPVPVRIRYGRFTGQSVKGFDQWMNKRPSGKIVNLTHFPMRMDAIHAYRMKAGRLERISRHLKEVQPLSPKDQRTFSLPAVENVLGENILVAWLGASLDTSCDDCFQAIDRDVRKGVALAPASALHLEAIPGVFRELGIYKLVVRIRSPYFVAGGSGVREKEVSLTETEHVNSGLLVYVPEDRGPEPLLYQYRFRMIRQSGDMVESTSWQDARGLSLFFGTSQLEAILAESEEAGGGS